MQRVQPSLIYAGIKYILKNPFQILLYVISIVHSLSLYTFKIAFAFIN